MHTDGAMKNEQHDLNGDKSGEMVELRTDITQSSDSEPQEMEKVERETSQIKTCSTQFCTSSTQPSDSEDGNKEAVRRITINSDVYVHNYEISAGTTDSMTNNEDSSATGDDPTTIPVRCGLPLTPFLCKKCQYMRPELQSIEEQIEILSAKIEQGRNIQDRISVATEGDDRANFKSELLQELRLALQKFLQVRKDEFDARTQDFINRLDAKQQIDDNITKRMENPENITVDMVRNQDDDDHDDIRRALDDVNDKLFWLFKMFCNQSEPIKVNSAHRSNDLNKLEKEIINFRITRFYDNGSSDNKMVESEYSGTVPDNKKMGDDDGKDNRFAWPRYENEKKINSRASSA